MSSRPPWIEQALEFAWSTWSELGLAGHRGRTTSRTAADPEALLLFTLEVARHDPRLFDEVLDWLLRNEPLISVQRARNLCLDDEDRALLAAALGWVAERRPRTRLRTTNGDRHPGAQQRLFYGVSAPDATDPVFATHGFDRAPAEPSGKSVPPDFSTGVAFALRLRRLFGNGVRAEVVRALLTIETSGLSPAQLQRTAGFSGQNVREATAALHDAGVAMEAQVGRQQYFRLQPISWEPVLGTPPNHRDWIQLLGPARMMLRWLAQTDTDALSPYLRASRARDVVDPLLVDLHFAGFRADDLQRATGADYWASFETLLDRLMQTISQP